ncbi:MAG: hypothetical protein P4L51_28250 [Puia sp.]|nr:hypothetical protein [Puia sp.]
MWKYVVTYIVWTFIVPAEQPGYTGIKADIVIKADTIMKAYTDKKQAVAFYDVLKAYTPPDAHRVIESRVYDTVWFESIYRGVIPDSIENETNPLLLLEGSGREQTTPPGYHDPYH